jgi:hypothetical protein
MVVAWIVLSVVQKRRAAEKEEAGKREVETGTAEAKAGSCNKALRMRRPVRDWLRARLSEAKAPGKDAEAPQPAEERKQENQALKKPHAFRLCKPVREWLETKVGESCSSGKEEAESPHQQLADKGDGETQHKGEGADHACV